MLRDLSSQPDAGKFRSTIVVIIILTCIGIFLLFTSDISEQAERIAHDQVVTHLDYSLAMTLYDYTIQGKVIELESFDGENPFIFLAIYRSLPENYFGNTEGPASEMKSGWYFDHEKRRIVYVWLDRKESYYRLQFKRDTASDPGRLVLTAEAAGLGEDSK